MRGFALEKTLEEVTCSMETLPEKILKIPGIALVAAGTPACLTTLYDSADRIHALDRLFLCEISAAEYSLGKQGVKIWDAVEQAAKLPGIRGVIIYASCMEVLTMWDFEGEQKKAGVRIPVEILYRGPLVKRRTAPVQELKKILAGWNMELEERAGENKNASEAAMAQNCAASDGYVSINTKKPQEPYFIEQIRRLADTDCDILLFTPGGCASSLKCLPPDILKNVWNTRFTDYVLSQGKTEGMVQEIKRNFPETRPLYLMESAVPKYTGIDLKKLASELTKAGKETCFLSEADVKRKDVSY